MTDFNSQGYNMEISKLLIDAAHAAVQSSVVDGQPVPISGFPEMFVIRSDHAQDMQVLHYFSEENARYAIGALRT